ncbi:MAG: F0F1 ATP synthase subunit B [Alphaproteobacteria bacterium]|nr:F0F1 ATP synthase subunit B [Alphaproteobacteria bacterium]
MHETSILNDTLFWYSIAVVAFAVLAVLKIRGPILGMLDGEIAKVRNELDEAKKLHAEAEATLAEYKLRQQDATKEAELIVQEAKKDAARLRVQAEADLKAALERHEQLFLARVKLAHEEAIDEVRAFVIDEILIEARGKLNKISGQAEATALVDRIIADLPKLSKSKVA